MYCMFYVIWINYLPFNIVDCVIEQVTVQKKLLDKEQSLYNTLLGHWMNTAELAATGLSVNFSADDVNVNKNKKEHLDIEVDVADDVDFVENQSDPDYSAGDEIDRSPRRKKSQSSLRRQRQSARSTRNSNVKSTCLLQSNNLINSIKAEYVYNLNT